LQLEELQKAWRERGSEVPIEPSPTFNKAGLVLGAGTVLAPESDHTQGHICLTSGGEARLIALLAAAYQRTLGPADLGHVRRAIAKRNDGEATFALIHLALARLGPLNSPRAAAERLFLADRLMEAGATPLTILKALDLDADILMRLYNPEEARVPPGSGRPSGEWTDGGAPTNDVTSTRPHEVRSTQAPVTAQAAQDAGVDALSTTPTPADEAAAKAAADQLLADFGGGAPAAQEVPPEGWVALARLAATVSAPAVFFGVLLTPTTAPAIRREFPGHPGYFYEKLPGEVGWHVFYANRQGESVAIGLGPDGFYRDAHGQPLARVLPGWVLAVNPAPTPPTTTRTRPPQTCPLPTLDKPGQGEGARSKQYEDQMKALLNPTAPTPSNFGRQLPNPLRKSGVVIFDDCWLVNGTMFEYKGPGFAGLIEGSAGKPIPFEFIGQWLEQSLAQVQAAALSNRRIVWVFAERSAAQRAYELFQQADEGRENITIAEFPYLGD
jgi:hypothetical protein